MQGLSYWEAPYLKVNLFIIECHLGPDSNPLLAVLMVRTYAIWGRKRSILGFLMGLWVVRLDLSSTSSNYLVRSLHQVTVVPLLVVCYLEIRSWKCWCCSYLSTAQVLNLVG